MYEETRIAIENYLHDIDLRAKIYRIKHTDKDGKWHTEELPDDQIDKKKLAELVAEKIQRGGWDD